MNPGRFQGSYREPIKHPHFRSLIPVAFISVLCGCLAQCQLPSQIFLLSAVPPPESSFMIFQLYLLFLLLDSLRVPVSLKDQPIFYLFSLPTQAETFCSILDSFTWRTLFIQDQYWVFFEAMMIQSCLVPCKYHVSPQMVVCPDPHQKFGFMKQWEIERALTKGFCPTWL